jgi:hypothetical protein
VRATEPSGSDPPGTEKPKADPAMVDKLKEKVVYWTGKSWLR